MTINLRSTYDYFKDLPHQNRAINFLQENVPQAVLDEFTTIWRNNPSLPGNDPQQLSPNFHLSELIRSQTASRYGISNNPDERAISNLRILCQEVLQPVRDHFGQPVVISSGYRSPALNTRIGGSRTSQHCLGQAADLSIPGVELIEVARWIKSNLTFDQLILEYWPSPNAWVHVSYRKGNNRKQSLQFNGRQYRPW